MKHSRINYLIKKLKQGKEEYFDEFYNLTKSSVFYNLKKIIYDKNLIEDVMQETYIQFLNSMNKIDENNNPISYLLTISKNKAIDELRKNRKYNEDVEIENLQFLSEEDNVEFPLIYYLKHKLDKEEFDIFEKTIILGYKRVEVAKMLNKPISTINWQYNKILKKVKTLCKEVYNE